MRTNMAKHARAFALVPVALVLLALAVEALG